MVLLIHFQPKNVSFIVREGGHVLTKYVDISIVPRSGFELFILIFFKFAHQHYVIGEIYDIFNMRSTW
jgi:hypothetical protein